LAVRAAKNIVAEIGETTKAFSAETTEAMPDVPWRAFAGTPGHQPAIDGAGGRRYASRYSAGDQRGR